MRVENVLERIEGKLGSGIPEEQKRFFAIKLLERDDKIAEKMAVAPDVSSEIEMIEKEMDDDAESIITNERYVFVSSITECCYKKNGKGKLTISDKIDRIVTNRLFALPIFAVVMFLCIIFPLRRWEHGRQTGQMMGYLAMDGICLAWRFRDFQCW